MQKTDRTVPVLSYSRSRSPARFDGLFVIMPVWILILLGLASIILLRLALVDLVLAWSDEAYANHLDQAAMRVFAAVFLGSAPAIVGGHAWLEYRRTR